ncbi:MAG: ATP-binding protein [Treponema sp.]|jgi:predicted AAA+ superfamily ATPase|nr:ATP-binding protein [Treponema sp.]
MIAAVLGDMAGISLFKGVQAHPLLRSFRDVLESAAGEALCPQSGRGPCGRGADGPSRRTSGERVRPIRSWAAFTARLARTGQDYSWYNAIARLTLFDDNPFTRAAESQENPPAFLRALAKTDLSRLGRIAAFAPHKLGLHLAEGLRNAGLSTAAQSIEEEAWAVHAAAKGAQGEALGPLGIFPANSDWGTALPAMAAHIHAHGAALLGQYRAFCWIPRHIRRPSSLPAAESADEGLDRFLKPIENPDPIRLAQLCGYQEQRSIVIANTLRFVEGGRGNNLLLYGDRGTGKSASVKAAANAYACRGLKLLELNKADLPELPHILKLLRSRSRRFILFIDDLSFERVDDAFRSLKALLEGCVEVQPGNTVIYATSNRRHLVKEPLADRPTAAMAAQAAATGDLRSFDTMQEQFSLADRFGLTVIYTAPDRDDYVRIAEHIARDRGLLEAAGEEELGRFRADALRWEQWFNGRSARTAVQYVDWIAGAQGNPQALRFPWE